MPAIVDDLCAFLQKEVDLQADLPFGGHVEQGPGEGETCGAEPDQGLFLGLGVDAVVVHDDAVHIPAVSLAHRNAGLLGEVGVHDLHPLAHILDGPVRVQGLLEGLVVDGGLGGDQGQLAPRTQLVRFEPLFRNRLQTAEREDVAWVVLRVVEALLQGLFTLARRVVATVGVVVLDDAFTRLQHLFLGLAQGMTEDGELQRDVVEASAFLDVHACHQQLGRGGELTTEAAQLLGFVLGLQRSLGLAFDLGPRL